MTASSSSAPFPHLSVFDRCLHQAQQDAGAASSPLSLAFALEPMSLSSAPTQPAPPSYSTYQQQQQQQHQQQQQQQQHLQLALSPLAPTSTLSSRYSSSSCMSTPSSLAEVPSLFSFASVPARPLITYSPAMSAGSTSKAAESDSEIDNLLENIDGLVVNSDEYLGIAFNIPDPSLGHLTIDQRIRYWNLRTWYWRRRKIATEKRFASIAAAANPINRLELGFASLRITSNASSIRKPHKGRMLVDKRR